jgi:hypothetical protein
MADNATPNEDHELPETPESLRAAAREGRQAAKERDEARRELLFTKAGIDIETKLGKLLFETWKGDITDVAGLRTEAAELGLIGGTSPDPTAGQTSQQEFRQTLSGGAPAGAYTPEAPHPVDAAYEQFYGDIAKGVRRSDAALAVIDRVLSAGASGDERVIFKGNG